MTPPKTTSKKATKKPPNKKLSPKKANETKQAEEELAEIAKTFEQIGFRDFINFLQSPKKIMFRNFLAGIFRGVGIVIGMTVVVALIVWTLTQMVDFPLIGQYFQDLLNLLESAPTIIPNGG